MDGEFLIPRWDESISFHSFVGRLSLQQPKVVAAQSGRRVSRKCRFRDSPSSPRFGCGLLSYSPDRIRLYCFGAGFTELLIRHC